MSLIERAKKDWKRITSNTNEFGVEIILIAPGNETATVNGLHSKHHLGIDTDGNAVNTKNAHITVAEDLLVQQNYPVRNSKGEVSLKDHKVVVKDSTGIDKNYYIKEWFPDETIGVITCILGVFKV